MAKFLITVDTVEPVGSKLPTPVRDEITDLAWGDAGKPAVIAAGADAAAARAAIDAVDAPTVASIGARSLSVKSKSLGGNIVVKPGYDWRHLWSEWDWTGWIQPQIDRAVILGLRGVRLISGPRVTTDTTISHPTWATSTAYPVDRAFTNSGNTYLATTAGTSASSGSGPTGTGSAITDGTVVWKYLRPDTLAPLTQAQYDARWTQLVQYCASKGLDVYPCLCQISDFQAAGGGYQNSTVTTSIVATARNLAAFPNVIGFDIFQEGDPLTGTTWKVTRTYAAGQVVNNGGLSYVCTTGGTAAASGGPTGTGTGITDGTAVWSYGGVPLVKADVLALLAAIRGVCNVPITMSTDPLKFAFSWNDSANLFYLCAIDPAGLDFIDVHLYTGTQAKPEDMDFLASQSGKPIMVGEFGADQSLSSGNQVARYATVVPIHKRDGVIGSYVWALADQGTAAVNQAGVWDNTGFAQGSTPLSTTSGVRSNLAGVLRQMSVAQPIERAYVQPNLIVPSRARPPRGSTTLGGYPGSWFPQTNSQFAADGRGLGIQCIAGGASTGIYVLNSTSVLPILVTANTWYRVVIEVVADAVSRTCDFHMDWYDDSASMQSRSPGASDTFRFADEVNIPTTFECLVYSGAGATRAEPRINWSSSQVTNEIHILRSFRMELA